MSVMMLVLISLRTVDLLTFTCILKHKIYPSDLHQRLKW